MAAWRSSKHSTVSGAESSLPFHAANGRGVACAHRYTGLAILTALAAALRWHHSSEIGIWIDEAFTLRMSEFPWGEMLQRIAQDTHPPLFYFFLKVWRGLFGESHQAARALSVIFGTAAVPGMYLFVRECYRNGDASVRENFRFAELPALTAAALMAIAPMHVFWSLMIRMYALPTALAVWSSYLLMRSLRGTGAGKLGWGLYALAAAMLSYSHYFGLFTLAAQFVFALGYLLVQREGDLLTRITPLAVSGFVIWVLWQPWLPFFLEQRARVAHTFYIRGDIWDLTGQAVHGTWTGPGMAKAAGTGWIIVQATFLSLLVLLLGRRPADIYVALAAATPVVAAMTLSHLSRPLITPHYLQFGHVFQLAAAAIVASRFPHVSRYVAVAAVLIGMGWLTRSHHDWRDRMAERPGVRAAVARLDGARQQGEYLLVPGSFVHALAMEHTTDRRDIYLVGDTRRIPFFTGTAVIREEDCIEPTWLSGDHSGFVWTLDAERAYGRVHMPDNWELVSEEGYRDWYAEFQLRLYRSKSKDE